MLPALARRLIGRLGLPRLGTPRAGVAELADAQLSKSCEATRAGSSPASGINSTSCPGHVGPQQARDRLFAQ